MSRKNKPELEMKQQAHTTKDTAAAHGEQQPLISAAAGDNRRRSDVATEAGTTFSVMTSQDQHRNESAEATDGERSAS